MKSFSTIFTLAVLIAFMSSSIAQTEWYKYPGNPVLRPGSIGTWEVDEVYAPFVLKHGDTLKMWYTGSKSSDVDHIGYAISTDGIHWQKETSNPVLRVGSSGSWDVENVVHSRIIFDDTTYHMWYGGSDDPSWYTFSVGYATSTDGITWTKYDDPSTTNPPYAESDPVMTPGLPGSWDSATLAGASYYFDGDTFHVWYGGCDSPNWANSRIGYAKSPDGINWVKYPGNPVFSGSSGSWDSDIVNVPCVIVDSSGYKMWYQGYDGTHTRIGYATSSDGINWEALDSFVLDVGNPGTWDDDFTANPHVLLDDTTYYMWYSGARDNTGGRIGYASTSPFTTGINDNILNDIPQRFYLSQNYPNPFNPSTIINYELPIISVVKISIYNLLGQRVTTLVNEQKRTGYHHVEWDASQYSSGIYYYRIEVRDPARRTGEYQDVKKMILLR